MEEIRRWLLGGINFHSTQRLYTAYKIVIEPSLAICNCLVNCMLLSKWETKTLCYSGCLSSLSKDRNSAYGRLSVTCKYLLQLQQYDYFHLLFYLHTLPCSKKDLRQTILLWIYSLTFFSGTCAYIVSLSIISPWGPRVCVCACVYVCVYFGVGWHISTPIFRERNWSKWNCYLNQPANELAVKPKHVDSKISAPFSLCISLIYCLKNVNCITFHKYVLAYIFALENSGNICILQLSTDKYPTNEMSSYKRFQTRKTMKSTSASRLLSGTATCLLPSSSSASGPTNPAIRPANKPERRRRAFSTWSQTPGYLRTCGYSLSYKDDSETEALNYMP